MFWPGEKNPSDLSPRRIRGEDLADNETCWNGAKFLKFPKESWPSEPAHTKVDENDVNAEVMKSKPQHSITRLLTNVLRDVPLSNVVAVVDWKRYSIRTWLQRVTAKVMRFIRITRTCRSTSDELTTNNLKAALWIRSIKANSYKDEEQYLSHVEKKKALLVKQLSLFLHQEIIIRCCGRSDESPLAEKQPILLTPKTPFH